MPDTGAPQTADNVPPALCTHYLFAGPPVTQLTLMTDDMGEHAGYLLVELSNTNVRSGTVCTDGFNAAAARVACRQLGLSGGKVLSRPADPDYDRQYKKMMSNVTCKGTEGNLTACVLDVASKCASKKAAAVSCTREQQLLALHAGSYRPPIPPSPSSVSQCWLATWS